MATFHPCFRFALPLLLSSASCCLLVPAIRAQGSLTPPAGAPSPTMRTLAELDGKLDTIKAKTDLAEARIPISGGGPRVIVNSGSYYLTGNILVTTDNTIAISVFASNVTIDLNGFSLVANVANDTNTSGISTGGELANLTVRNGHIDNFGFGVVSFIDNTLLEDLKVTRSKQRGINLIGTTADFRGVVRRCVVMNTDLSRSALQNNPALAIAFQGVDGTIEDCTVIDTRGSGTLGAVGIYGVPWSTGRLLVTGNRVVRSTTGVQALANTVYRNNTVINTTTPYSGGVNGGLNYP
jgi:hypothetical protein